MSLPGEVTTALAGIRQRAEVTERAGYRIGEDACLLLSVVDEVLALADPPQVTHRDLDGNDEGPVTYCVTCDRLRETISHALLGTEGKSDG